jgi:cyclopropane-fatty-acyl-phospholipid synthase
MSDRAIAQSSVFGSTKATPWQRAARHASFRLVGQLRHGCITLIEGDETVLFGNPDDDLQATVIVNSPEFYSRMVRGGAVGAGEAYMEGLWDTPDLYPVIRLIARNVAVFDHLENRWGRAANAGRWLLHGFRRNSIQGSRKNIHAHYDLGNDFLQRWLDPQMMYSSAIYPREDATLDEASIHKLWTVCRKLKLSTGDHLLEIGTGWGAMAIHAAQHFGCRVTTATISQEQFALARERVAVAGLSDRVEVVLCDYRELSGSYDKLVSIEMIEAVGDAYLDTFFSQCSNLLKPNGVMLLQAITCPDQVYEQGKHTIEFVKRHIFPGGQVPSVARMMDAVRRKTDLRLEHAEDFGRHYARTLLAWRDNFQREVEDIRAMGYPETFLRMWEYYLSYCAGGFTERQIGVCHLVLSKPDCRAVWGVGDSPALAE